MTTTNIIGFILIAISIVVQVGSFVVRWFCIPSEPYFSEKTNCMVTCAEIEDMRHRCNVVTVIGDDGKIQFQKIAENFHLIEEDTVTVIIPQTPEAVQLIAKLRNQTATRRDIRKVGKYSVNVRRKRYNDRLADITEPLVMNTGKTVDICCLTDMHRYTKYGLEMS